MAALSNKELYMLGAAVLVVGGFVGYRYYQKTQAALVALPPTAHTQPPGSGSQYTNASFTSGGIMSTMDVQKNLNSLGVIPPLVEDGVNGPNTSSAVAAFQTKMGLSSTGTVDAATANAISNAVAALSGGTNPGLSLPAASSGNA